MKIPVWCLLIHKSNWQCRSRKVGCPEKVAMCDVMHVCSRAEDNYMRPPPPREVVPGAESRRPDHLKSKSESTLFKGEGGKEGGQAGDRGQRHTSPPRHAYPAKSFPNLNSPPHQSKQPAAPQHRFVAYAKWNRNVTVCRISCMTDNIESSAW